MPRPEVVCARLARRQFGVLTRADARRAGLSDDAIWRRVSSGVWLERFPRTYVVEGAPPSWHQDQFAACAWTHGVSSHRAAAHVLGIWPSTAAPLEVTVDRSIGTKHRGIIVHRSPLLPADVRRIQGMPVTTAARTLLDLGAVGDEEMVEQALEDAIRRRLVDIPTLRRRLDADGARGRNGTATLRGLLRSRSRGYTPTESVLEVKLARLIRQSPLPAPVQQHVVRHRGVTVARVDFAYPEHRLAVEADSYTWHSGRRAWARDRQRSNRLIDLGWRVIYVTHDDVVHRSTEVVSRIAVALKGSAGRLGPR